MDDYVYFCTTRESSRGRSGAAAGTDEGPDQSGNGERGSCLVGWKTGRMGWDGQDVAVALRQHGASRRAGSERSRIDNPGVGLQARRGSLSRSPYGPARKTEIHLASRSAARTAERAALHFLYLPPIHISRRRSRAPAWEPLSTAVAGNFSCLFSISPTRPNRAGYQAKNRIQRRRDAARGCCGAASGRPRGMVAACGRAG